MTNKIKLLIIPFAVIAVYYWIKVILNLLSAASDFSVITSIIMIGLTIISIVIYLTTKEESSKK